MSYHRARQVVLDYLKTMEEGQRISFDYRLFQEAYPCGWPSIYNTPIQAFLSTMVGSAWGIWRCKFDPMNRSYIVSKHPESNKRYYIDPDREFLFRKMPDGTLERRDHGNNQRS